MKYEPQISPYERIGRRGPGPSKAVSDALVYLYGFSLIELMVAMVVALFLLLGMSTIFVSTRQTYSVQTGMAQLQDNERVAMSIVANIIQSAGYFTNPTTTTAAVALPASGNYLANGQPIFGADGASASVPDSVQVRYQTAPNDGVMNCQGGTNGTGSNHIYDNLFSINGNGVLQCQVIDNGTLLATQPLVSGVSNFKVYYSVASATAPTLQYMTATGVAASGNWPNVKAVRIDWTFTNPSAKQPGQPATIKTFTQVIQLFN